MNNYLRTGLESAKWLLPMVFLVGYALTMRQFDQRLVEYFLLNLAAFISCAVLLTQINILNRAHSAAWVALMLLVMGYFIRFYWVSIDPMPVKRMLPEDAFGVMVVDREALFVAFRLSVAAFISFCISAGVLAFYFTSIDSVAGIPRESRLAKPRVKDIWCLVVVLILMAALALLTYSYRIGEMGAESGEPLPFRLRGVIFYARTVCIPILLLMCIFVSQSRGNIILSRVGMLALIVHGISDMLLRNSRSAFLLSLLLLGFLVMSGGVVLRRKEKILFGFLAIGALILVPVMTDYRQVRLLQNLSHVDALVNALNNSSGRWINQLVAGLKFVMFRMPGVESLWSEIALGAKPLGAGIIDVIRSKNGVAGYLSYVIHPIKESNNTLLAPGFAGWFYLVGGLPAIIAGSAMTAILAIVGWRYLDVRYLRAGPVAQVFFLWILFLVTTEGALDSMSYMIAVGVLTLCFMEFFLRRSGVEQ